MWKQLISSYVDELESNVKYLKNQLKWFEERKYSIRDKNEYNEDIETYEYLMTVMTIRQENINELKKILSKGE